MTFDQVKATFAAFQNESDRAAAILSVSLLNDQLEEILTKFGADEGSMVEILKPEQPIAGSALRWV